MPGTNVIVSASQITIGTKMSASKMIITTGTTVIVIGNMVAHPLRCFGRGDQQVWRRNESDRVRVRLAGNVRRW